MSKLAEYRAERDARIAGGAALRPIDAELTAAIARLGDEVAHLGGQVLARHYRRTPDAETVHAAWRAAETHFRRADDRVGGEGPAAFSLCDGTTVHNLAEARSGVLRAEERLNEVIEAESLLAAKLKEIVRLRQVLQELDVEGAV